MINRRDVITIKLPFPNTSSGLAVKAHMYICQYSSGAVKHLLKCQTLKPAMLSQAAMKHYLDEVPDINRNPFMHTTRIDCDKLFMTIDAIYSPRLKAKNRSDVCEDVMTKAEHELFADGYQQHTIPAKDLCNLNSLITVK